MNQRTTAQTVALMGVLSALALALSALEGLIPHLPFLPPGAKAGFSNVIILFAVNWLGGPYGLIITLFKALFALLTRGGLAALMSLCGGVGATLVTWACVRLHASRMLTGILGALTHNLLQLLVILLVTATPYWMGYLPFLLLFALCSGAVTGLLFQLTDSPLRRLAKHNRLRG